MCEVDVVCEVDVTVFLPSVVREFIRISLEFIRKVASQVGARAKWARG